MGEALTHRQLDARYPGVATFAERRPWLTCLLVIAGMLVVVVGILVVVG